MNSEWFEVHEKVTEEFYLPRIGIECYTQGLRMSNIVEFIATGAGLQNFCNLHNKRKKGRKKGARPLFLLFYGNCISLMKKKENRIKNSEVMEA
jgi:hypothetical protein